MTRLLIVAEGWTEVRFAAQVLRDHLAARQVFASCRCVETGRRTGRVHRGGVLTYRQVRGDLIRWMKEDQNPDAWFTTMIDLYGLPADFPGRDQADRQQDARQRVRMLQDAFAKDMDHRRFVPYIQLHEFEALLLADPGEFASQFPQEGKAVEDLRKMAAAFDSPELIDDDEKTAPSKRIIAEIPAYERRKTSAGPIIAWRIGLQVLRQRCPHFGDWLARLEALGRESAV